MSVGSAFWRNLRFNFLQSVTAGYGLLCWLEYGKTSIGIGLSILTWSVIELCRRMDGVKAISMETDCGE